MVVLGGSKVSDKLGVIETCCRKVDRLLIGGGMCFTFLKAQGHEVGKSLLEEDLVDTCAATCSRPAGGVRDRAAGRHRGRHRVRAPTREHDGRRGRRDPGRPDGPGHRPGSRRGFADALADARTVFWNGPMGVFELAPFAAGTRGVAEAHHQGRRLHRRRRRRLGRGGARSSASRRGRLRPHLHRRRRVAWSTSRARPCPASQRWRTERGQHDDTAPAADRRQLEDEPQPLRGDRAGPEARVHA